MSTNSKWIWKESRPVRGARRNHHQDCNIWIIPIRRRQGIERERYTLHWAHWIWVCDSGSLWGSGFRFWVRPVEEEEEMWWVGCTCFYDGDCLFSIVSGLGWLDDGVGLAGCNGWKNWIWLLESVKEKAQNLVLMGLWSWRKIVNETMMKFD